MGTISNFNLDEYIKKYNIDFFIETGTWLGDGVEYATKFTFKKIFSIELIDQYYIHSRNRFKDNVIVEIIKNNSMDGLTYVFDTNKITNTIFWLDAHLPNLYNNEYDSDYLNNKNILIPLEEELKIIKNNKDIKNDVFIIDDLRIYEKGNFQNGEWLDVYNVGIRGTEFVNSILGETHSIAKIYDHQGYLICLPK